MSSLGIIVYLIGRAIPKVNDAEENMPIDSFQAKIDKLIAKIPFDEIDFAFSAFVEKSLRKIKLLLMKWDNVVTTHIEKIKKIPHGGFGGEKKEEKQKLFSANGNGASEGEDESDGKVIK